MVHSWPLFASFSSFQLTVKNVQYTKLLEMNENKRYQGRHLHIFKKDLSKTEMGFKWIGIIVVFWKVRLLHDVYFTDVPTLFFDMSLLALDSIFSF